jgi:hypothetical protein
VQDVSDDALEQAAGGAQGGRVTAQSCLPPYRPRPGCQ